MSASGPLGPYWTGDGTHFRVFSGLAERVELCFFDERDHETRVDMSSEAGQLWHYYARGVGPGQAYGFRVHGPYEPPRGLRCNGAKLLADPYARALHWTNAWHPSLFSYPLGGDELACESTDSAPYAPRSFVVDPSFDWGDDRRPTLAPTQTVIYELHVKGFTQRHPGVPSAIRGTYSGLASDAAIASLLSLGITAVELMPIHQFAHESQLIDQGLRNYWGYNTYGLFAPHAEYSCGDRRGDQVREFKALVKRLHQAGLHVYLDVVYNHTAEGNHLGPTLSFKGFDNPAYYHLVTDEPRYYMDFTGTGNSMNLRHPYSLQLVIDSLRYWVSEMHVDGFRFDLAATLARGPHTVDTWSAFFATIHQDPVLQRAMLIAEPWDTGDNGYQVGNFSFRWSEWNDKYRETIRAFWREDGRDISDVARRLTGSADLFQQHGRRPWASINYVSSHDGLTLRDLAQTAPSASMVEASRGDAAEVTSRLQRGLLATLFLSMGVPMLTGGDEAGRTQHGDANAYCQDNDISWIDWDGADTALRAFTASLIALRPAIPWLQSATWPGGALTVQWWWPEGREPGPDDWTQPRSDIGMLGERNGAVGLMILNAGSADVTYKLPSLDASRWRLALHSSPEPYRSDQFPSSNERIDAPNGTPLFDGDTPFVVDGLSVVVFLRTRVTGPGDLATQPDPVRPTSGRT